MRHLRPALLTLGASALLTPAGALGADQIYWTNTSAQGAGAIGFANVDGAGGGGLFSSSNNQPEGLALDPVTSRLYVDEFFGGLSSLGLDGGGVLGLTLTNASADGLGGLALDPLHRRVYWTNFQNSTLSFTDLDGPANGDLTIATAPVERPVGIAVDPAAGRLYWTNVQGTSRTGTPGSVVTADLQGGDAHEIPLVDRAGSGTFVEAPGGVAVDPVHGRLYVSNDDGRILSSALDGSDTFELPIGATHGGNVVGLAIDPFQGRLYWTDARTNQLFSGNLDGTDVREIRVATAPVNEPSHVLLSFTPRATAPPAIGGGVALGATLSCSQGTWAPDLPSAYLYDAAASFAYQWSRDGADIPGATQPTLRADAAGAYRCRVTAANRAGETAQTSEAHAVGSPTVQPPTGRPAAAPHLTAASLTHTRFRIAKARTAIAAAIARGTTLRLSSDQAAHLTVAIDRLRPGRRVKHGAKTTCKTVAKAPRRGGCVAAVHAGTLTRTLNAGRATIAFSGRIGTKPLPAGRYRLTLTAHSAGGTSNAIRLAFTILRG